MEPLSCRIDSTEIQDTAAGPSSLQESENYSNDPVVYDNESLEMESSDFSAPSTPTSIVPKLIDRKHKHLERLCLLQKEILFSWKTPKKTRGSEEKWLKP